MTESLVVETIIDRSYKLNAVNFNLNHLEQVFLELAKQAEKYDITIVDALNWLPNSIEFQKNKTLGQQVRLVEYKTFMKTGWIMLLASILLF